MRRHLRVWLSMAVLLGAWLVAPEVSYADFLVLKLPEGNLNVTAFDFARGNMVITGVPSSGIAVGTVVETYFQSKMSSLIGASGLPISGLGLNSTYELTEVARFTQLVTAVTPTSATSAIYTFALNPVQVNPFFEVWFHNGLLADNFNGTGFNTGTKILSGVINSMPS